MRAESKPVIGISSNITEGNSCINMAYVDAIRAAGGIALLIPSTSDSSALIETADLIDGLLLTGGADVDAKYFGESNLESLTEVDFARDSYDFSLLKVCADRCIPIFGICRGEQVINIAFGGDIYQDIKSQYDKVSLDHKILTDKGKGVHGVTLIPNSLLSNITGKNELSTNSRHHQSVRRVAEGFKATAFSSDGIVEAIEGYPSRRIFGVQWHPENMAGSGDESMKKIFSFFVEESILFKRAKFLHDKLIIVDSHTDTPMLFGEYTIHFSERSNLAQVDAVKMKEGKIDAVFVVAYISQNSSDAKNKAISIFRDLECQVSATGSSIMICHNFDEISNAKSEGKKSILFGIENGKALEGDRFNIGMFKALGVSYITLCHNGDNDICDSASGLGTNGGLSEFGKLVVQEMNRQGVMIDISHASASSVADVLKLSTKPIFASHSSVYSLCNSKRNLTDSQIKELALKGGVIQICLYYNFLNQKNKATVMDAVAHIDYVKDLVGIDYVGIGSDFDGGGGVEGCNSTNELINITVELLRRGYTDEDIAKVWGGNLRRVMDETQKTQ